MRKSLLINLTSAFKDLRKHHSLRGRLRHLLLAAPLLLLPACAFGQATGQIAGVITDPAGRVVPAASVELTNTATSQVRTTVSGPDGAFTIPLVNPGIYQVKVSLPGFKTNLTKGVVVAVNGT